MSQDPLDEHLARLFAAGRAEAAPDETQRRILVALRAQPDLSTATTTVRRLGPKAAFTFLAAAVALTGLLLLMLRPQSGLFRISAENLALTDSKQEHAKSVDTQTSTAKQNLDPPAPVLETTRRGAPARTTITPRSPARSTAKDGYTSVPASLEPASLEQELAAMQKARTKLDRGDAAATLVELDQFSRNSGWKRLSVEASLLRIEALAQVGRSEEARSLAQRFVEQHPNNPLVDRAQKFADPPAPQNTQTSPKPKENTP